ncbi:MAG: hypothetical protein HDR09_16885 [Lachnospiraceae bacterium]|nr:hypothetical protein [Lachnospiraceae bacterium]
MKNLIMTLTVMVFVFILLRKKLLPLFRKKKSAAVSPETLPGPCRKGGKYFEVLSFDTASYAELSYLNDSMETQINKKIEHNCRAGVVESVECLAVGSLLIILVCWRMEGTFNE